MERTLNYQSMPRKARQNLRQNRAFTASALIHALLAIFAIWLGAHPPRVQVNDKKLTWIELEPATPKTVQKEEARKEVVQTLPGKFVDKAEKDAFLGEHTQTVDRQTVSRNKTTVIAKAAQPTSAQNESQSKRTQAKAQPKAEAEPAPLAKFGVPMLPFQKKEAIAESVDTPTPDARWAEQGQQLQEYVKGFKEGDQTALNTREFVFYGYFTRIREKLDRAWVPILKERVSMWYRGGRRIASETEHITKVLAILNDQGEITEVKMLSESGTRILDEAAVKAFNEAGPFPNPPTGLINEKRQIEVPWEFVLRT